MELVLEMLREAAVRLHGPVGQTIGVVGGIVIGQAAVQAGIVSNVMVIVVSITAVASFIILTWKCQQNSASSLSNDDNRFFIWGHWHYGWDGSYYHPYSFYGIT